MEARRRVASRREGRRRRSSSGAAGRHGSPALRPVPRRYDRHVRPAGRRALRPEPHRAGRGARARRGRPPRATCTTRASWTSMPLLETETSLVLPMKPLCREECRGLVPGLRRQPERDRLCLRRARARAAVGAAQGVGGAPVAVRVRRERTAPSQDTDRSEARSCRCRRDVIPRPWAQRSHPLQDGGADAVAVPAVPRGQASPSVCPHCGFYKGREVISVEGA